MGLPGDGVYSTRYQAGAVYNYSKMRDIFTAKFHPGNIIDNPSEERLRDWALEQGGVVSEFGNLAVTTRIRNRIAKFTEVVLGEIEDENIKLVGDVLEYLNGRDVIMLDRVMCQSQAYKKRCRVYVDAQYPRIPLMWGNTLFPAEPGEPDFITVTVPDWPEKKVLVFPEAGITMIMGSDYKGRTRRPCCARLCTGLKKKGTSGCMPPARYCVL